MKLSDIDFLQLLRELMVSVGWTNESVDEYYEKIKQGKLVLPTLCANIATQCFIIGKDEGLSVDFLRQYLHELHNIGYVKFAEGESDEQRSNE